MRRIAYALLLPLLFLSCAKEGEMVVQWDGPVIELTLSCDDLGMTKAGTDGTQDGDNDYFENVVKWVDFYFYPVYPGESGSSITHPYHKRLELTNNVLTFRIEVTSNQVNNQIFPTDECQVLALVNVPKETLDALEDLSLEKIYEVVEITEFAKKKDSYNHRQDQFMMSGLQTLQLSSEGGRTAKVVSKGTVPVARYACKLTMGIKVEDSVLVDTGQTHEDEQTHEEVPIYEEWRPSVEEMYIYLVDGVKSVTLDGIPVDTDKTKAHEEDHPVHFEYKKNPMYFYEFQGGTYKQLFDKDGDYYTTYPTYTYPQSWTSKSGHVPYLKLVLPWIRKSDNLKKVCYYKIILPQNTQEGVPAGKNAFLRNNWYHYNIQVGMLGADTDDADVEVNPINFYIYYWQDKNIVIKQASIGNARYLSVDKEYKESADEPEDQKYYELNNETSVDVTYTSSHPVTYDVLSVTRPYYGKKPENDKDKKSNTYSTNKIPVYIRQSRGPVLDPGDEVPIRYGDKLYPKGSYYLEYDTSGVKAEWFTKYATYIRFNHTLINTYTDKKFDYSPYTIFLSVYHSDDLSMSKEYSRTVKIIQYPAVYIVGEENSDEKHPIAGISDSGDPQDPKAWKLYWNNGYVFVDGARRMRHDEDADDKGPYGIRAKLLNANWTATSNYGTVRKQLEWMQWRIINYTGGNRNMYNIVVTVLPTGSSYVIGDPRTLAINNLNNGEESYSTADSRIKYCDARDSDGDGVLDKVVTDYVSHFQDAPALYPKGGGNRSLTYYYPADDSDRTINMVAPSYRVASKFGGLEYYDGVTKRSAEYKCATYQEDGYPAGRWRLPTKAEIDFIATLSAKGTFEVLFGTGSHYWSAHGAVQPGVGVHTRTYALARCVYDSWYWDHLDDRLVSPPSDPAQKKDGVIYRDQYFFGDMPR